MGFPTKVQLIKRKASEQWYINFPAALAQACEFVKGEIVEWVGWAIATWSLPGLAFAAWTIANLAPRARAHHIWYHERFPDYPADRRALLPGLW